MSVPVAGSSALLAAPVIGVRPRIGLHLEFDLVDAEGRPLGAVTEQAAGHAWLLGNVSERHWLVTDAAGQTVFLLHKPGSWGTQHFSVVDAEGAPVGEVQQLRAASFQFQLTAADGGTARLRGQFWQGRHWTLEDADGNEVGQVTDTFPSLSHLFTHPNTFIVELGTLAGQLRALALTSAVCLEVISVNR